MGSPLVVFAMVSFAQEQPPFPPAIIAVGIGHTRKTVVQLMGFGVAIPLHHHPPSCEFYLWLYNY